MLCLGDFRVISGHLGSGKIRRKSPPSRRHVWILADTDSRGSGFAISFSLVMKNDHPIRGALEPPATSAVPHHHSGFMEGGGPAAYSACSALCAAMNRAQGADANNSFPNVGAINKV